MRVVTYNIRHGLVPGGRVDIGALAEFCAGLEADILALQEVDQGVIRSGFSNTVERVSKATGLTGIFGQARRLGPGGRYGNALFVRGDFEAVDHLKLPRDARRELRGAILAMAIPEDLMDVPHVSVATTHLGLSRAEALRQLGSTLNGLVRRPLPHLLLGDLNLGADIVGPACADAGLLLADPSSPSFPADDPEYRIDHIAVAGLEIESVWVEEGPVSDHRAVIAELRFG